MKIPRSPSPEERAIRMVTVEHLNPIDGWAVKILGAQIGTAWSTKWFAFNGNHHEPGAYRIREYIATNIRAAMEPRRPPNPGGR